MLGNAKGGRVSIGDTDMDYISFGTGRDTLLIIPGLGDGLTTVKGMAAIMALSYRIYAKDYKVYMFSRKNKLQEGYSTRDMAKDQARVMNTLGITKADVLGISQGGMIAQYLAIDYPHLVGKLILAVTLSRQNEHIQENLNKWIGLAEQHRYQDLMADIAEKSYSANYLKKYRRLLPLLTRAGRPKDFSRFLIQADSCMRHDAYAELCKITCPALVIGGADDQIASAAASAELAQQIKHSELYLYEGLGHAAYEEAKDFHQRVLSFLITT